jgi:imidazolonepropionase-like amidohydrolase
MAGLIDRLRFSHSLLCALGALLLVAQSGALAKGEPDPTDRLVPRLTGPVAFVDVRLYDADAQTFLEHRTVVVSEGRIAAQGPSASTPPPADARVIPGRGKTLLPGLWDSHMHVRDDTTASLLLAQGVTSVREMGSPPDELLARMRRIERGELPGPRIVPMLLIDGPGRYSNEYARVVRSESEALAVVRRAKAEGYAGIKIYGSLAAELLPAVAKEAKALGLRLLGHVPRTLRPLDAVRLGYDEITHMNFVLMQAMPDSVVDGTDGPLRWYGPAKLGPGVSFSSGPMKGLLDEMARRGIAVDPTLSVFESSWTTDRRELPPAFAAFVGTLAPELERTLREMSAPTLRDVSRAEMRRGFAKLKSLIPELQRRRIPILAGTDGHGLELVRELELYVEAGLTPAEALATATIVPARILGFGGESGSLAAGKRAELILVDGDPSRRIGDLRKVEVVMRDGRLMQAAELRAAAGLAGGPR